MASVVIGGTNFGDVLESSRENQFPAMDSNYQEVEWKFTTVKTFNSFLTMLDFEDDINGEFSNRTKNVSYGGITISDMVLISVKRLGKPIMHHDGKATATFEIIATKENV